MRTAIRSRRCLSIGITLALAAASNAEAATVTVNSTDDSASSTFCNLRDALTSIKNGNTTSTPTCAGAVSGAFGSDDTVQFDSALVNSTITLVQGALVLPFGKHMTVVGSGQTIDAGGHSGVLSADQYNVATVKNLTFTGGNDVAGGGIAVGWYATLTLEHCTVSNNSASRGGGIYVSPESSAVLKNSIVTGNSAADGGGIYARGSVGLFQSTLSNNAVNTPTDHPSGGGIHVYRGGFTAFSLVVVSGSTISGNSASGASNHLAGAAYLRNTYSTFVNSTVAGNSAHGIDYLTGGIWQSDTATGSLTLTNTTVVSNSATSYTPGGLQHIGGGVVFGVGSSASTEKIALANTIVSTNTPSDVAVGAGATSLSASYNVLGSALSIVGPFNSPANHNIFSNTPGIGPLQNNGGPTLTMALQPGSPALRVGNPALAVYSGQPPSSQPLSFDQRGPGYARLFGNTVDIGAFEDQGDRVFADGCEAPP